MAAPGVYTVRVTSGETTVEQSFELLLDPRVAAAGITASDIDAQIDLTTKVADLLSEARKLADQVETKLKQLEDAKSKRTDTTAAVPDSNAPTDQSELKELRTLRDLLVRAEGRYTQPMLVSQIEYLYGKLDSADQAPGNDIMKRYSVLRGQFDELVKRFE
jgi:hypothetical protein